jgi:hypothetical protein
MSTDNPITDETLEKQIGIDKQGHRHRIMFRLQQEYKAYEQAGKI